MALRHLAFPALLVLATVVLAPTAAADGPPPEVPGCNDTAAGSVTAHWCILPGGTGCQIVFYSPTLADIGLLC